MKENPTTRIGLLKRQFQFFAARSVGMLQDSVTKEIRHHRYVLVAGVIEAR